MILEWQTSNDTRKYHIDGQIFTTGCRGYHGYYNSDIDGKWYSIVQLADGKATISISNIH